MSLYKLQLKTDANGTVVDMDIEALRAIQDGNGNNIADTYVPIDSSNARGHFRNNTTYTEMSFEDGTDGSSAITLSNIISLIAADSNNTSGIALLKNSILVQAPQFLWKTTSSATAKNIATEDYVQANPTLAGGEADLTSLQVGNTKYAIPSGGGTQVQSNWNETDTTSPAYIQNKPTIPDISDCLQKTGGQMTGPLSWKDETALPQKTLSYILGIDGFSQGGQTGWESKDSFLSSCLKSGVDNNMITHTDEFNFASSGQSGAVYFNYRTAGGTNGNITEYKFGNGKGGSLGTAIHTGNIGSYVPTKKYKHHIYMEYASSSTNNYIYVTFTLENTRSTEYTSYDDILNALNAAGFNGNKWLMASGKFSSNLAIGVHYEVTYGTAYIILRASQMGNYTPNNFSINKSATITDNVTS